MPSYIYQAINENGNKASGTLEADSVDAANSILALRGLIPLKMIQERDKSADNTWSAIMTFTNTIKVSDLIIFTKQFRSMLGAGVPILRLLQVLEAQTESRVLRTAIAAIIQ